MEEQEREREGVAIGTPLGLSAKGQRMEQDGWAATPWGESAGERSSQTQRSSSDTRGPRRRGPQYTCEDLSLDARTIFVKLEAELILAMGCDTSAIPLFR